MRRHAVWMVMVLGGCATDSTVAVTVGGPGSVRSEPRGIDCSSDGGTCSMTIGADQSVELIAETPAIGAEFVGWSGSCGGTDRCIVDATNDVVVGASFAAASRTLTVVPSGTGAYSVTSTPAGISCGSGPSSSQMCTLTVPKNTTVLLETAHDEATTELVGWTGDPGCSDDPGCSVVVDRDRTIDVMYAVRIFLRLEVSGPGNVTGPNGLECPASSCRAQFPRGSVVTVHAQPSPGATFSGWLGPCGAMADCTVTMNFQTTLSASFAPM